MINYGLTIRIKNVSQHATKWKIAFADKVVGSKIELAKRLLQTRLLIVLFLTTERQNHHMQVMKKYCYIGKES